MHKLNFLFLVANTPWVYALAEALAANYPTTATRFYDWRNYLRLRPSWSSSAPPPFLQRSFQILPPGYCYTLEGLFRPYLQAIIKGWYNQLEQKSGVPPWVILPYPYSVSWIRHLPPQGLIYYNLDEYTLYQPSRKEHILRQEAELVDRSALILCIAKFQVEALQQRYPHKAQLIHHFPLGAVEAYLNPQPHQIPASMTVGYVGNLVDRVDWKLVFQVAKACPEITFVFVGSLVEFTEGITGASWLAERASVLKLPNVRHIDKVPQAEVARHYWLFAINWIPYGVKHPFNLASCPTKVMDGIASGRPVLSTNIPECRLYPEWISTFHSVEEAIALIRQQLSCINTLEAHQKSLQQVKFAAEQTWQARAKTLATLLAKL